MPNDRSVNRHLEYQNLKSRVFVYSQVSDLGQTSVQTSGLYYSEVLISATMCFNRRRSVVDLLLAVKGM